jgi:hypothetical protein
MKAKSTVPEKGKRLEPLNVEPSIDLQEFPELHAINDVLEKLYRNPKPSIIDCEDESRAAYKNASALLAYAAYADVGLNAEGSALAEPMAQEVMDSIQLQLDIVRLAGKLLYSRCQAFSPRES